MHPQLNRSGGFNQKPSVIRDSATPSPGCRHGASLELATFPSIGIDPDFEIHRPLPAPTRLFKQTDDNLFRDHDPGQLLVGAFDLAFIDGMHRSQFVLRDFINLEHHAHPGSVILVDDLLTEDMSWTTRERKCLHLA